MPDYLSDLLQARLLHPEFRWVLLLLILFPLLWFRQKQRPLVSITLRSIVLILLVWALCEPVKVQSTNSRELAVLIDTSYSITSRARASLVEMLKPFAAGEHTTLKVIPFARQTANAPISILGGSTSQEILQNLESAAKALDTGETDISAALRAVSVQSQSASALLLSDGFETSGNAVQAARVLGANGIHIYPLIPREAVFTKERLTVSSLYAPITAGAGDKVDIRASIMNSFSAAERGELQVWLDKKKLFSQSIEVPGNQERLITIDSPELEGGLHRLRAVIVPESSTPLPAGSTSSELHRWISVKEKAKILLISGTEQDARVVKDVIRFKGYGLSELIADGRTDIPESFEQFSTIILNNASKAQVGAPFLARLKEFAEKGGGVMLVGGDRSFGLGGYINTPLEEISPLKFVPPQTEKKRLTVAVALVLDKSGSMIEQNKILSAKQSAIMSVFALKDDDQIAVIGFDSVPFVVIDLAPVREVKDKVVRRVAELTPTGHTNLLPALQAARQMLREATASRKHIIVMSDGKIPPASDDYVREINTLRQSQITRSAIAL